MMRRRKAATEKPRIEEELVLVVVLVVLLAEAQSQEKLAGASVRTPVLSEHLMHFGVVPSIQLAMQDLPEPAPAVAAGRAQAVQVTLVVNGAAVPAFSHFGEKPGLHLMQLPAVPVASTTQHPLVAAAVKALVVTAPAAVTAVSTLPTQ
jgi:hypothetical protein